MKQSEFVSRRSRLSETLQDGDLLLMFAGNSIRKTADEDYPFFTNRSFLYLTGIKQEASVLMMCRKSGVVYEKIYVLMPDVQQESWTGRRFRPNEITEISGIDAVADAENFEHDLLAQLNTGTFSRVWLALDGYELENSWAKRITGAFPAVRIRNIFPVVSTMRKIKSPEEIAAIREGMKITNAGIRRMMRAVRPGMMEYQLEAEFLHELGIHGQRFPAFPSIVAAGERNFYLHYPNPMSEIKDGELVLTDVGAPYDDYNTDISRVFPANGKFSERQALIYQIAYDANRAVMAAIKPGLPHSINYQTCKDFAFERLKDIGLLKTRDELSRYVWHGTSHHVGMDTHDVGGYRAPITPNMVYTVDAGIYVREWGIGLRIEDNILVTETGCENLSRDIPSSIEEIEEWMQG